MAFISGLLPIFIFAIAVGRMAFKVIDQYEAGVIFRFGRLGPLKAPGLRFILPFVDRLVIVDQRTITIDIPQQDVITKDNVSVKVSAILAFKVMDPVAAVVNVDSYLALTSRLAQTTLRSVCGQAELDELLVNREQINDRIQDIIDHQTAAWGVKVTIVEIRDIDLPQDMQRAMARQAEAERERRAKIIKAEGEYQAAEKLTEAAEIMSRNDTTIQLRYLETLRDISVEQNSTILFPLPIEMLKAFGKRSSDNSQ
jgi:regulator of protease activity HflC (stomatin/prohibitin superfamily)